MCQRVIACVCGVVGTLWIGAVAANASDQINANTNGSVFFTPNIELRWDSSGQLVQDTFVHLFNNHPGQVDVFMYFVNGDPPLVATDDERAHPGWNRFDTQITLTANQPVYWSTLSGMANNSPSIPPFIILDPGTPPGRPDPEGTTDRVLRGYLVGWAINLDGEEIKWNHLSATATVIDFRTSGVWGYNGYHAQALNPGIADGVQTGTPGVLNFNNVEFSSPHSHLMFNFPAEGATPYSSPTTTVTSRSDLTLHPVSVDLRQNSTGPIATNATFSIWNMNEVQFTGVQRCISCWDQTLLQIYAAPNFFDETILQTEVGWAQVDGNANANCNTLSGNASVNAALIGVLARKSIIGPQLEADYAGINLFGRGTEHAIIRYDVPDGPPERSADTSDVSAIAAIGQSRSVDLHAHAGERQENKTITDKSSGPENDATTQRGITSQAVFSTSQPGNLLYISKVDVRWDAQGNLSQNTFIHLTNWFDAPVRVQMYFVNGDPPLPPIGGEPAQPGWNALDVQIELTANQPVYWSAAAGDNVLGIPPWSDLDPGPPPGRPDPIFGGRMQRGYIIAWAVDEQCQEIAGNVLMADAVLVNYIDFITSSWGYNAYHAPNVAPVPFGEPSGTPGVLTMADGAEYPPAFDFLTFISAAINSNTYDEPQYVVLNSPDVTLHQATADFTANSTGPLMSKASYRVWNQLEFSFSGMYRCITCWDQTFLAEYTPFNFFDTTLIQTDIAAARIDGIASIDCDTKELSVDAPMFGLISNLVIMDAFGTEYAWFGHNMFGVGTEDAEVRAELCDPPCPWDIATPNGPGQDGDVNVFDLLMILANWNTNGPGAEIAPAFNVVDVFDLLEVLQNWGPCP